MSKEHQPVEFFHFDRSQVPVGYIGEFWGEFLNRNGEYTTHLATHPGSNSGSGRRMSVPNNDDFVVTGISREGWYRLTKDLSDAENPRAAIVELPYITWDKQYSGR